LILSGTQNRLTFIPPIALLKVTVIKKVSDLMSKPESNTVKETGYLRIDFIGKVYTCYTVTILQKLR